MATGFAPYDVVLFVHLHNIWRSTAGGMSKNYLLSCFLMTMKQVKLIHGVTRYWYA
jgi:hypothetical protein